jgi:glycosyltransferase involved in cell wall biosynthesis
VLHLFLTSSYYKRDLYPDRLARLIPKLDIWLQKRFDPAIDPKRICRFPLVELPEMAYRLFKNGGAQAARLVELRDMRFDEVVSRFLHKLPARIFWGFQGSCLNSLHAAREAGMKAVVELASIPAQVAQALLAQDGSSLPEPLFENTASRHSEEYRSRLNQEPAAADICIAASTFTAKSLQLIGIPAEKVRIIPLGVDFDRFSYRARRGSGPLRVLFVGKLARHKGLHFLLEAVSRLRSEDVTLSLAGPSVGQNRMLQPFKGRFHALGSLDGEGLLRAYAEHDVLVLPSIYDGFGLVVLEAMASGIPVIATTNTCAPDIVREGVDGFVVPAFSADAIADRIDWFASNRALIPDMGCNAAARAREFSWEKHAKRVALFVASI